MILACFQNEHVQGDRSSPEDLRNPELDLPELTPVTIHLAADLVLDRTMREHASA